MTKQQTNQDKSTVEKTVTAPVNEDNQQISKSDSNNPVVESLQQQLSAMEYH